MLKRTIVAMLLVTALPLAPVCAREHGVTESVLIHASQDAVWEAVRDTKHFDNKIESHVPNEAVVEQRFRSLPLIGETTATIQVTTIPKKSIDYHLIHSNHLKALRGSWLLTPISPSETKLQLSSYVVPGLPVPRFLINNFVAMKVRGRLHKVKVLAEAASQEVPAKQEIAK